MKIYVYEMHIKLHQVIISYSSDANANWAVMKLDANNQPDEQEALSQMPAVPPRPVATPETRTLSAKSRGSTSMSIQQGAKSPATVKTFEMPLHTQQMPMVC